MSSSRDRNNARHRAPGPSRRAPEEPAVADGELDSYLAALTSQDDQDTTELTGRFGTAQVFQLRLPALRIEQLRRIAEKRGVAPAALAMDWVVERLDREDGDLEGSQTGPLPAVEDQQPRRGVFRRFTKG